MGKNILTLHGNMAASKVCFEISFLVGSFIQRLRPCTTKAFNSQGEEEKLSCERARIHGTIK